VFRVRIYGLQPHTTYDHDRWRSAPEGGRLIQSRESRTEFTGVLYWRRSGSFSTQTCLYQKSLTLSGSMMRRIFKIFLPACGSLSALIQGDQRIGLQGATFLIRLNPSAENLAMFAMKGRLLAAIASSAAKSLSLTCDWNGEVESSAVRRAEGGP
jgi:hypothetical protein